MTKTFFCEACQEAFESDFPDDEALAEFTTLFPECEVEDAAVICHDCWTKIMGVN